MENVLGAFTMKMPIQTLLSVAPTLLVFWRITQFHQNDHTLVSTLLALKRFIKNTKNATNFKHL